VPRVATLAFLCVLSACQARGASPAPAPGDAALHDVTVRVPGALRVARALDTLSVEIDPAASADTTVHVDPGMVLGVESETRVFAAGDAHALDERHGYTSGASFDVGTEVWKLPQPGKRYVAEMTLTLFETDITPRHMWDPHAGRYKALLTRTLRQAEE